MPTIRIVRFPNAISTPGVLLNADGYPFCMTLELPWLNNQHNISCIPEGTYRAQRCISPKYGVVFEVLDVPGRSGILIHAGNYLHDTKGCILLGETCNLVDDAGGVLAPFPMICNSRATVARFIGSLLGTNEFELEISRK